MKQTFSLFTLLFISVLAMAQGAPKWLRYPVISPDGQQIVFTYKGNLFKVPVAGGEARQLTFHDAHDYKAIWSKDGKTIAFASDRYGNFDVYSMPAEGGPATRLTFHSTDEAPFTFAQNDSLVLFGAVRQDDVAHRQYPTGSQPELYQVAATGGRVDQVLTVPAEYVQVNAAGTQLVYHDKKGGENEFRKHQVSSIARDIWTYDMKTGKHTMITTFPGEDRHPVYAADEKSIYYLSEESGVFNVHKRGLSATATSQQLTNYDLHPVRSLSMGNGVLCFSQDGELYTLREGEVPKKVNVIIRTQYGSNPDKFISINGGVNEFEVAPNGKEIAFIARGEVFVTSVDGSMTKRITNTPEQEKFVTFGPDGKSVVYASERNGKWHIFETKRKREKEEPFFFASTILEEKPLISTDVDNYLPKFSPDGKKLAYVENRRTIKVIDMDKKDTTALLTPDDLFHMRDGDKDFTWSPDSKWLLIGWSPTLQNSEVLLMAADGSKRINLTESGYQDFSPQWANEGKQMIWFSNRNGMKSYATSGRTESDVYTMFFSQEAWDKSQLSKEEYDLMKELEKLEKEAKEKEEKEKKEKEEEKKKGKKDKKDEEDDSKKKDDKKDLEFDWDNMKDRKKRLTIHSAIMGDAVLSKDGETLYYLARFEKGMNLWSTNLRTKETKMALKLNAGYGSLQWDKKMENLYLLSSGSIAKIEPDKGKRTAVKIKGEMEYDAEAERIHMFDHVWLRTKAIFYTPDMHGTDWELMRKEYEKYLPHVGNSYEFSELLSELLGELNVSHAGGRYSGSISNSDATASLGILMDYKHKGDGIKIAEILQNGPLDKAKFDLKPGLIIERIDGELIAKDQDVARYLNRKAGNFTLLDIVDPATKKRQQITMKPTTLGAERSLLYDRWVKMNEKEVVEKSKGELGYVHIPGMSDGPYRNIYEKMLGKHLDKKAMVIDTRFNGGGDLVADLAMFFTGVPFITYATEDKVVGGEPTSRYTKPTLALFNESMYSDGHCFASGYTDLEIGKTVGMPVPGTCSFAGWERLPNGGVWGVVPVSAKNKSGEWMENNQTEPSIKVKNMPDVIANGRDEQLERAIEELLKDI